MLKKTALYTTLFGEYETLNELNLDTTDFDAFCFTDMKNLTSSTWKIIQVDPYFPEDKVRSQRMVKILGHPKLNDYEFTFYKDNSVELLLSPVNLIKKYLDATDIAIPHHSFRSNVFEEFDEVIKQHLDSRERVKEQQSHYLISYPKVMNQQAFWTALIARRNTEKVRELTRIWANHVLRYSRRDQLSFNVALLLSKCQINTIQIDNHSSEFHSWPIESDRKVQLRFSSVTDYEEQFHNLQNSYELLREENKQLSLFIEKIWDSLSWKITKPLRFRNYFDKR